MLLYPLLSDSGLRSYFVSCWNVVIDKCLLNYSITLCCAYKFIVQVKCAYVVFLAFLPVQPWWQLRNHDLCMKSSMFTASYLRAFCWFTCLLSFYVVYPVPCCNTISENKCPEYFFTAKSFTIECLACITSHTVVQVRACFCASHITFSSSAVYFQHQSECVRISPGRK